jgi:hypothetical protein
VSDRGNSPNKSQSKRPINLNDQALCGPAMRQLNLKQKQSFTCRNEDCNSQICRPSERKLNAIVEDLECDSCEEIENIDMLDNGNTSDDSSLGNTMEAFNEVLGVAYPPDDASIKRDPIRTAKQEFKKNVDKVKDASVLKSFAYGK